MNSPYDVYDLVARIRQACLTHACACIDEQLDDAMHAGTSGLEILGRIRYVLRNNLDEISTMADRREVEAALEYIDRVF